MSTLLKRSRRDGHSNGQIGRAISAVAMAAVIATMFLSPTASAFSGGDGSSGNPYQISNVTELQAMQDDLGAHYTYILMNDIDASATWSWNGGAGFDPVGNDSSKFTGTFNGNGYIIENLYINRPSTNYVGLFGYAGSSAVIKNVGLEDANLTGSIFVGGLVGWNYGTLSNSYSISNVTGHIIVGGLVGFNYQGTVSNCYSTGRVNGNYEVGGLVGRNYGTISNSYSTGSASGSAAGGLVGFNYDGGTVSNSYSTGRVTGNYPVGGLVGWNDGKVSNSFWDTQTSGQSTSRGGTGKTTAGMKTKSTFTDTGWDFTNVWWMDDAGIQNDGYPELNSESD